MTSFNSEDSLMGDECKNTARNIKSQTFRKLCSCVFTYANPYMQTVLKGQKPQSGKVWPQVVWGGREERQHTTPDWFVLCVLACPLCQRLFVQFSGHCCPQQSGLWEKCVGPSLADLASSSALEVPCGTLNKSWNCFLRHKAKIKNCQQHDIKRL